MDSAHAAGGHDTPSVVLLSSRPGEGTVSAEGWTIRPSSRRLKNARALSSIKTRDASPAGTAQGPRGVLTVRRNRGHPGMITKGPG
jgi:hypothetical protein